MDVTTAATEVRTGETVAVRRICYQEFASEALVAWSWACHDLATKQQQEQGMSLNFRSSVPLFIK